MAKFTGHPITDDSALGGSVIQRSLRFNDSDSTWLERSVSQTSNRKTFTISVWIKRSKLGNFPAIFGQTDTSGSYMFYFVFDTSDQLYIIDYDYPTNNYHFVTNRKFRDTLSWYHIVLAVDTTQATNTNRSKLYVNGVQETSFSTANYPAQNLQTFVNHTTYPVRIGRHGWSHTHYLGGYMAEYNFVDGQQLDPTHFGYTESQTGLWRSKRYEGTYGTNGFYLDFSDNSSTSALGIDKSPNGNDLTTNNFSVSSGKDGDSFIDTPSNNFSTLNPLVNSNTTQSLSDGNLTRSGGAKKCMATFEALNGKYYFEYKAEDGNGNHSPGVCQIDTDQRDRINTEAAAIFAANGEYKIENNSQTSGFAVWGNGDIISVAIDTTLATPKVWFAVNNSWQGASGDSGTFDPFGGYSLTAGKKYTFTVDHGSSAGSTTGTAFFGAHQGEFNYDPPSGFKALSTKNLPPNVPSIIRPQKHFDTVIYTGNDSSQSITSLEFQPDFIWFKNRGGTNWHALFDSVRGRAKGLASNKNNTEYTSSASNDLVSFDINGFTLGSNQNWGSVNGSSNNIVAWCWKAGGAAVSNTNGNITSSVSVNEEAGFSIVSYTGNGSNGQTVGHGLSQAPQWIILKNRDATQNWRVWQHKLASDGSKRLLLDATNASENAGFLNDTAPTSTVFTLGNADDAWNANGDKFIAYCWHEVPGYSKFGSHTGNGSTDGTYVDLGFRPAWILVKRTSGTENWALWDNKRDGGSNPNGYLLRPDSNSDEGGNTSGHYIDILSNGFKFRNTDSKGNGNGSTYIYMAFAEQPGTTSFDTFPNAR